MLCASWLSHRDMYKWCEEYILGVGVYPNLSATTNHIMSEVQLTGKDGRLRIELVYVWGCKDYQWCWTRWLHKDSLWYILLMTCIKCEGYVKTEWFHLICIECLSILLILLQYICRLYVNIFNNSSRTIWCCEILLILCHVKMAVSGMLQNAG